MFHISGKSAMSAPMARARRQKASPLRRFASWSVPKATGWSRATVRTGMAASSGSDVWLERDHLVRRVAGERGIEVGEATDLDSLDGAARPAITRHALGQSPLQRALVAEHEQDVLLLRDLRQALAERVTLAQEIGVVVEEEHADDVGAVPPLLQLGQDHLAQLVAGGVAGGAEDIGNLHGPSPPSLGLPRSTSAGPSPAESVPPVRRGARSPCRYRTAGVANKRRQPPRFGEKTSASRKKALATSTIVPPEGTFR